MNRKNFLRAALLGIFLFFGAQIWLSVRFTMKASKQSICTGNINTIGYGILQYREKYGRPLPAYVLDKDGRPMHSWRALILEFIDTETFRLYSFDEPWDGPKNKGLHAKAPSVYRCPSDISSPIWSTSYVAIVEKGQPFPGDRQMQRKATDDLGGNLLVAETTNIFIPWLEPRDLEIDKMTFAVNSSFMPGISSDDPKGPGLFFRRGGFFRIREDLPSSTIRLIIAKNIEIKTREQLRMLLDK